MSRLPALLLVLFITGAAAAPAPPSIPPAPDELLLERVIAEESIESTPAFSRLDYLGVVWRRLWRRGESVLVAWGSELTILSFALIGLLLAGAVAWILANIPSLRERRRKEAAADSTVLDTRAPAPDYLALAEQARAAGDLALCWRLRWQAAREALARPEIGRSNEHLTNLEFVAAVRAARPGWPALDPLERLARQADAWFYGGAVIDEAGLERAESLVAEVLS